MHERVNPYGAPDEVLEEVAATVEALIEGDGYPNLTSLAENGRLPEVWRRVDARMSEPDRFERALRRLSTESNAT